jgi:acetylornithine deacetylase/succinyl-diaminopimelate desuccinylase-like protein
VGGSIPIAASIMKVVDQVVIMGYGLKSGHAHGPNENIYVDSFYKGINTAIKFIEEVGNRTR